MVGVVSKGSIKVVELVRVSGRLTVEVVLQRALGNGEDDKETAWGWEFRWEGAEKIKKRDKGRIDRQGGPERGRNGAWERQERR